MESIELPLLGDWMNAKGRNLINSRLRDYAREEPVYRLGQRMFDTLGPRRATIALIRDGCVLIKLDRQSSRRPHALRSNRIQISNR